MKQTIELWTVFERGLKRRSSNGGFVMVLLTFDGY